MKFRYRNVIVNEIFYFYENRYTVLRFTVGLELCHVLMKKSIHK